MAVKLDLKGEALKETHSSHIQYIPCNISYDGDAPVDKFFTTYVTEQVAIDESQKKCLTGTFRGYPLQGCVMDVPDGYTGVVLKETRPSLNSDDDRTMRAICQFEKFTFWNWDREPSRGDRFQQAMDWVEIANVIHSGET
ncbi:ribonuclease H2 subunit C [Procambarus clarkii]|uniref:ribonuclease H2 subunit C n=1 Tax=Procambarus clarkii TaxID=6728 RepID=UPI001E67468A|nr:ribonuclease H2 subunit C-like [Procambarus clarkii]